MQQPKSAINTSWEEYYKSLEQIRRSGICNMWGAAPILAERENITRSLATKILLNWIENYDELKLMYNWA